MIQYFFPRSAGSYSRTFGTGAWTDIVTQASLTGNSIANYAAASMPICAAGTFRNLKTKVTTIVPLGYVISTRLYKNATLTNLHGIYGPGDTETRDIINSVHVNDGDTIAYSYSQPLLGYTTHFAMSLEFESDVVNECIYGVGGNLVTVDGGTNGVFGGTDDWQPFSNRTWHVCSVPGTIAKLAINLSAAPGAGKSKVFNIWKNGVIQDGSLGSVNTTTTVADGVTTGSATFSLSVVAEDYVWTQVTHVNSPAASSAGFGIKFVSHNDTDFPICGLETALPINNDIAIYSPSMCNESVAEVESLSNVPGPITPIRLTGVVVLVTTAPGVGSPTKERTWEARRNDETPFGSPSVTLSTSEVVDTGSGDMLLSDADEWCVRSLAINNPASADGTWSFIGTTEAEPVEQASGIYELIKDKTNDTLWIDVDAETTEDVKIP